MVEMTETANILHNATERSLILIDEIGRGTSTFDGLSIAWATALALANEVRALTFFATHYFELTALPEQCPTMANVHLDATEHEDHVVFLHHIREGLQIAVLDCVKSSWYPHNDSEVSRGQINELERGKDAGAEPIQTELYLTPKRQTSAALEELADLDPDDLSAREALDKIYSLKQKLDGNN